MTGHELAYALLKLKNLEIDISVDPVECRCGNVRVFSDKILEVSEAKHNINILCVGNFNLSSDEVIDSINGVTGKTI